MNTGANAPSRNAPCPCGSGKKYKRCCAGTQATASGAAGLTPAHIAPAQNLEKAGRFRQANQLYGTLLLRYTDHPALLWGRGRCLMHMGQSEAAATALTQAAEHYAGNQKLLEDASSRLILLGKPQAALQATQAGVKRFPDNIQLMLNRADALRLLGQHDSAIELLRAVHERAPQRTGVIVSLVNSLRSSGQLEEALEIAETTLDALAPNGLDYAGLLNELAHCQQRQGLHETAYANVCKSGEIALATPQAAAVNGDSLSQRIDSYREWIETNGLAQRDVPDRTRSAKLIFMVGFPRSGTTLLESMLAAHPRVKTSGEAPLIGSSLRSLLAGGTSINQLQPLLTVAEESDLTHARDAYWDAVGANFGSDFDYFVDKQPLNIIELPLIRTLFPDAKIILSLRDPRDVCLSCLFQWFALTPALKPFMDWDSTVAFYAKVMDYWGVLEPLMGEHIYPLRYEDLTADFTTRIRQLADHLELPWDDAILSYADDNRQGYFHTPSNEAVRKDLDSTAVERWRHYPDAVSSAEPVLAPSIDRLGYR